jgi:Protein of unknown function (DUF1236)
MSCTAKICLLVLLGTVPGSAAAFAQSAGPDEVVQPNGSVGQNITLTAAQRSAIFNAIFRQPVKPSGTQFAAAVGASVPQTVDLIDLPDSAGDPAAAGLKYAMAENDLIIIVDTVQMRVVDVIHNNAKP